MSRLPSLLVFVGDGGSFYKADLVAVADTTSSCGEVVLERAFKRQKEKLVKFLGYTGPRWMLSESVNALQKAAGMEEMTRSLGIMIGVGIMITEPRFEIRSALKKIQMREGPPI
jgi:hypothetical protein